MMSRSGYNLRRRTDGDNPKFRCKECNAKYRSEKKKREMATMTPEEKAAMYLKAGAGRKKYLLSLPKESKDAMMSKMNEGRHRWKENVSKEDMARISQAHSDSNKRRWESMTHEEREAYTQKAHDAWLENIDLKKFGDDIKARWENYSPEKLLTIRNNMSNAKTDWWSELPDEKINEISNKIRDTLKKNWESKSDSYKSKWSEDRI